MNMNKRQDLVNTAVQQTIAYLKSDMPFEGRAEFIQQLLIKTSTRTTQSKGGATRQRGKIVPMINISLVGRHYSKQEMVNFWSERQNSKAKRVFAEQRTAINNDEWMFVEYNHVHNDTVIGKFVSNDPYHHVLATVLHEMAHAVHIWLYHIKKVQCDTVAHGSKWQSIYRQLRSNLLNNLLVDDGSLLLAAENSTGETPMATTKTETKKKKSTSKPAGAKGVNKKKRSTKKAATKKAPAKKKAAVKKTTGAVAQVWAICEGMKTALTNETKTRKDAIQACIDAGLNKSTAATQYQKWKVATYK